VISRVVLIVEENHSYRQIIGHAPYLTALARACGLAADYSALSYPSLPNYIGMTSGRIPSSVAGRDCLPVGSCRAAVANLFHRVGSWRVYAESMPQPCYRANTSLYLPRHTAAPYYTNITSCKTKQVRLGNPTTGALASALRHSALPKFSLVIPNAVNDMHGGCVSCGDAWIQHWLPVIRSSPQYQAGQVAIIITWDSDNGNAQNHIPTIVISPYTKAGTVRTRAFTHYSLLRAICAILHISPPGKASTAPGQFATAFHLRR
jgi:phospholipase C